LKSEVDISLSNRSKKI